MDIVIGIGNALRGDDGIGQYVVDAIPTQPNLVTMTVHQLMPELAETIHQSRRVLFVDASLSHDGLCLERLEPLDHRGLGHTCSPAALLGWMKLAFGQEPEAWLLSIPATSFEFGEAPSPSAMQYISKALECIESWLSDCPDLVLMRSEEEA